MHQHQGHDHHHHHAVPSTAGKAFVAGIVLNAIYVIAQLGAGLYTNSVALITDAVHNLGDVAMLAISFAALKLAKAKPSGTYTYGYKKTTILAALAAVKGGATDPQTIKDNYAAVSGATDGEECKTYADCVALIGDGKEIRYAGPSGIGPIDKENDPSSAFVGIYTFNADNKNELTSTVEGSKQ